MTTDNKSTKPPGVYRDLHCSVARTLEQIGERWTFLILRDSFYGIRRFGDFQDSLGIAKNILASRLASLVESGIMRKEQYQDHPPRFEYRLTEKGRDLVPMLTTLLAWGDKWATDGDDPVKLTHTDCGAVMHTMTVCGHCQGPITAFNLGIDPVPEIVQQRVLEGRLASESSD